MQRVKKFLTSHLAVYALFLSIVTSWLLLPIISGFPVVAFVILFIGVSSLLLVIRKNISWIDFVLYIGILILSCFTLFRANGVMQSLNIVFSIFFLSLLVRPISQISNMLTLLTTPFVVFFTSVSSQNDHILTLKVPSIVTKKNYLKDYLPSIIVTVSVLLVTIPLLASANPLFRDLLNQLFTLVNLTWLWKLLAADSLSVYLARVILFCGLFFILPRLCTLATRGYGKTIQMPEIAVNYLFPKIALLVTLIVFFVTQLQLYFASSELLRHLGYTNSRLTNEVFAQVTIVAFIILLITYLDKKRSTWNNWLTYLLLLEAFFLIGIAFKSVYDYSSLFGLTQKRLWGYASMTWLVGALVGYTYHYVKQTALTTFFKQMLTYTVLVVIAINIANFDYLIYHSAKPSTPAGIDYNYIARRSVDAHYYKEVLPILVNDIEKSKVLENEKIGSAYTIIQGIERLREKYGRTMPINSYNVSEYVEYLDTKDMNLTPYRNSIRQKQESFLPKPSKQSEQAPEQTPSDPASSAVTKPGSAKSGL